MTLLGLIGYPLSHSFSQDIFRAKFREENIEDADYLLFPLKEISDIAGLIRSNPMLTGLNVTIPYKEKVIPFLDELDETADKTGAVNTICIDRSGSQVRLLGYNTDVTGFQKMAGAWQNAGVERAIVLGTGGASKAVEYVLAEMNTSVLKVSRKKTGMNVIGYHELDAEIMAAHRLIVNTSPQGMFPEAGSCPDIPYEAITDSHIAVDLIYNPAETLFLKKCRERGAGVFNGLDMLYAQAEASWRIWKDFLK
jgi:shikimate dehydrogenase